MKKCPFCAEEIQNEAKKCKHCGEFLDEAIRSTLAGENTPWYFRKSYIVIAFLCVGPFALPMIWWRPDTSRAWKIGLTIIILVISWLLYEASLESMKILNEYYELMDGL